MILLKRWSEPKPSFPFTIKDIWISLENEFMELSYVWSSTVSNVLKKDLGLSYKRFSKVNKKNYSKENLILILKSALLLQNLLKSSSEVLFIDEFSYDIRKTMHYGWGPKNTKLFISQSLESFSISFIVGLSMKRYYGVTGKFGTIWSKIILKHLQGCVKQYNEENEIEGNSLIIVADNAAVHKSNLIKDWLKKQNIGIVTIAPYWPFLNPIESYISVIKSKVRANLKNRETKTFKAISLKIFKRAFDDWAKIDPAKFIMASRAETVSAISALSKN